MLTDRTQAFDTHQTLLDGIKVRILDLGGHKEYESCIAILGRDGGLYLCFLNPSDLESVDTIMEFVDPWINKILDGAIEPHFLFVITKIDKIEGDEEAKREFIKEKRELLKEYLAMKLDQVKRFRKKRKDNLERDITKSTPKSWLGKQVGKLKERFRRQTDKVKRLPNFNIDKISFVSSLTGDGIYALRNALKAAIKALPQIKYQKEWLDTIQTLLTLDRPYVLFDDLKNMTTIGDVKIIEMLKALSAMGSIVWNPNQKDIIFHQLDMLSILLKSIFFHEMEDLIKMFAGSTDVEEELLLQRYIQGQLPYGLIRAMFVHISKHLSTSRNKDKTIDFSTFDANPQAEQKLDELMTSFVGTLERVQLIVKIDDLQPGMTMYFVPHLIFQVADEPGLGPKIKDWLLNETYYQLSLQYRFDAEVGKATLSRCIWCAMRIMSVVATLLDTKLEFLTNRNTVVIDVHNYQIVIRRLFNKIHGHVLMLDVKLQNQQLMHETIWILMREIAFQFHLEDDVDCHLVCTADATEHNCDHGKYDPDPTVHRSLEKIRDKKRPKSIKCQKNVDLVFCFPTKLAIDIVTCMLKDKEVPTPFQAPPEPGKENVEVYNLISTIFNKHIPEPSKIMEHPAFLSGYNLLFRSIQPVRQYFDDITSCNDKSHARNCRCFMDHLPKFVAKYSSLEKNSAIATHGEWKEPLRAILEKHGRDTSETEGKNGSVYGLVRIYRNLIAHSDPKHPDMKLQSAIRAHFTWLVMHCFSFWALEILPDEPKNECFRTFASSFQKHETLECEKRWDNGALAKPVYPIFRVLTFQYDGTSTGETIFYFDLSHDLNKFVNEAKKNLTNSFPKPFKMEYRGSEGRPVATSVMLEDTSDLQALNLDTRYTQVVHINPVTIKVSVSIEDPTASPIEMELKPEETFEQVLEYVQSRHGDKLKLMLGKKILRETSIAGNMTLNKDHVLHLLAKDPATLGKGKRGSKRRVQPDLDGALDD